MHDEASDDQQDQQDELDEHEEHDELRAAVLEFVRTWPSRYPSAARIAQAVGRSPREVIEVLDRIRADGDYPASDGGDPESPGPSAPSMEQWDRAN